MSIERLNLDQPLVGQEPKKEGREKKIFSETFKAVTLAGILLLGAQEGFKTVKKMAITSQTLGTPEYKDGKTIIKGEIGTADGKKYRYEVPTQMGEPPSERRWRGRFI